MVSMYPICTLLFVWRSGCLQKNKNVYRSKNTEVTIGEDIGEEKCKGVEICFLKAERCIS